MVRILMFTPEKRLDVALDIARSAGDVLLSYWGATESLSPTKKGKVDLLTAADRASERLVVERIRERFPSDGIVGEEGGSYTSGEAPWTWVVDPLDGTTNFVHGTRHFSVSIGIVDGRGEPVAGVIHAPVYASTWYGAVGQGAFQVDHTSGVRRPIFVSSCGAMSEALVATGFPYDRQDRATELLVPFKRVLEHAQGIRRYGAATLDFVDVARGVFDAFFEARLAPWDMAAGVALVRAAGGVVSDYNGDLFALDSAGVVAAGPHLQAHLLALLRGTQG